MTNKHTFTEDDVALQRAKYAKYIEENEKIYHTRAFTEDDLKQLRQPNAQPLDSDYFVQAQRERQVESSSQKVTQTKPKFVNRQETKHQPIEVATKVPEVTPESSAPKTYYNLDKLDDIDAYDQFSKQESLEEKYATQSLKKVQEKVAQIVGEKDNREEQATLELDEVFSESASLSQSLEQEEDVLRDAVERDDDERALSDVEEEVLLENEVAQQDTQHEDFVEESLESPEQEVPQGDGVDQTQHFDKSELVTEATVVNEEVDLANTHIFAKEDVTVTEGTTLNEDEEYGDILEETSDTALNFTTQRQALKRKKFRITRERPVVLPIQEANVLSEKDEKFLAVDEENTPAHSSHSHHLEDSDVEFDEEDEWDDQEYEYRSDVLDKMKGFFGTFFGKSSRYQEYEDDEDEEIDEEEYEDDEELTESNASMSFDEEIQKFDTQVSQETKYFHEPILTDQALEEILLENDLTIEQKLHEEHDDRTQENDKLVAGTAWLTFGNVFSRVLGALYVIPWATWLGASYMEANVLFSIGYTPYALFLAIATAGFPSAISKRMAYHHSRKEYRIADQLFKHSLIIMLIAGAVSAGILFVSAPLIAAMSPTDDPTQAVLVIRSLVPALLILPIMSLLRGYFQGFNDMVPTAISQLLEQIVRVFYMLAGTYAVMQVYNGGVTRAVVHSTFAAFVGALASLIYLVCVYIKRIRLIHGLLDKCRSQQTLTFAQSMRIMLVDSVPFILLGSAIILAKIIDTYTFKPIMFSMTAFRVTEVKELYGTFSFDVDKLIMIVISLAVAMSITIVPAISEAYGLKNKELTSRLVQQVTILFSYIMLPAAVGMASVSNSVYALFYPNGSASGPALLVIACYVSIILGAYTVLSSVLQSMDFRRLMVQYLGIGLLVKLVLQFPCVALFNAYGTFISTFIGFTVMCVLMWRQIHTKIGVDYKVLLPQLIKIVIATTLMGLATTLWNNVIDGMFGQLGRGGHFVKVMLVGLVGIAIYLGMMALFGMLPVLFGNRKKELQEQLKVFR